MASSSITGNSVTAASAAAAAAAVTVELQPRFAFDLRIEPSDHAAPTANSVRLPNAKNSIACFVNDETVLYGVGRHFAVHHIRPTEFFGLGEYLNQNMSFLCRHENTTLAKRSKGGDAKYAAKTGGGGSSGAGAAGGSAPLETSALLDHPTLTLSCFAAFSKASGAAANMNQPLQWLATVENAPLHHSSVVSVIDMRGIGTIERAATATAAAAGSNTPTAKHFTCRDRRIHHFVVPNIALTPALKRRLPYVPQYGRTVDGIAVQTLADGTAPAARRIHSQSFKATHRISDDDANSRPATAASTGSASGRRSARGGGGGDDKSEVDFESEAAGDEEENEADESALRHDPMSDGGLRRPRVALVPLGPSHYDPALVSPDLDSEESIPSQPAAAINPNAPVTDDVLGAEAAAARASALASVAELKRDKSERGESDSDSDSAAGDGTGTGTDSSKAAVYKPLPSIQTVLSGMAGAHTSLYACQRIVLVSVSRCGRWIGLVGDGPKWPFWIWDWQRAGKTKREILEQLSKPRFMDQPITGIAFHPNSQEVTTFGPSLLALWAVTPASLSSASVTNRELTPAPILTDRNDSYVDAVYLTALADTLLIAKTHVVLLYRDSVLIQTIAVTESLPPSLSIRFPNGAQPTICAAASTLHGFAVACVGALTLYRFRTKQTIDTAAVRSGSGSATSASSSTAETTLFKRAFELHETALKDDAYRTKCIPLIRPHTGQPTVEPLRPLSISTSCNARSLALSTVDRELYVCQNLNELELVADPVISIAPPAPETGTSSGSGSGSNAAPDRKQNASAPKPVDSTAKLATAAAAAAAVAAINQSLLSPVVSGLHSQRATSGRITAMDVAQESPLIATCSLHDHTVRIWNPIDRSCEFVQSFSESPLAISLHPSGLQCCISFQTCVLVYRLMASELMLRGELFVTGVSTVRYSHGGQYFAVSSGRIALVYASNTLKCVAKFKSHKGLISDLCWSADDAFVTTCSVDGCVYQWSLASRTKVHEYTNRGVSGGGAGISVSSAQHRNRNMIYGSIVMDSNGLLVIGGLLNQNLRLQDGLAVVEYTELVPSGIKARDAHAIASVYDGAHLYTHHMDVTSVPASANGVPPPPPPLPLPSTTASVAGSATGTIGTTNTANSQPHTGRLPTARPRDEFLHRLRLPDPSVSIAAAVAAVGAETTTTLSSAYATSTYWDTFSTTYTPPAFALSVQRRRRRAHELELQKANHRRSLTIASITGRSSPVTSPTTTARRIIRSPAKSRAAAAPTSGAGSSGGGSGGTTAGGELTTAELLKPRQEDSMQELANLVMLQPRPRVALITVGRVQFALVGTERGSIQVFECPLHFHSKCLKEVALHTAPITGLRVIQKLGLIVSTALDGSIFVSSLALGISPSPSQLPSALTATHPHYHHQHAHSPAYAAALQAQQSALHGSPAEALHFFAAFLEQSFYRPLYPLIAPDILSDLQLNGLDFDDPSVSAAFPSLNSVGVGSGALSPSPSLTSMMSGRASGATATASASAGTSHARNSSASTFNQATQLFAALAARYVRSGLSRRTHRAAATKNALAMRATVRRRGSIGSAGAFAFTGGAAAGSSNESSGGTANTALPAGSGSAGTSSSARAVHEHERARQRAELEHFGVGGGALTRLDDEDFGFVLVKRSQWKRVHAQIDTFKHQIRGLQIEWDYKTKREQSDVKHLLAGQQTEAAQRLNASEAKLRALEVKDVEREKEVTKWFQTMRDDHRKTMTHFEKVYEGKIKIETKRYADLVQQHAKVTTQHTETVNSINSEFERKWAHFQTQLAREISTRDASIKDLERTVERLKSERTNRVSMEALLEKTLEAQGTSAELEWTTDRLAQVQEEKRRVTANSDYFGEQTIQARNECDRLRMEKQNEIKLKHALAEQLKREEKTSAELSARVTTRDLTINELRMDISRLESEKLGLREELKALFHKIDTNAETKSAIAYFDATVRSLDAEFESKHATIQQIQKTVVDQRARLSSLTTTLARMTKASRAKDVWIARVREDLNTNSAPLEVLRRKYCAGSNDALLSQDEWERDEKQNVASEVFRQSQMYHKSLNLFHSSVYRERARLAGVEQTARQRNADLMTQINELRYVNKNYKSEIAALKVAVDDLKLRELLTARKSQRAASAAAGGIHYEQKLSATLRHSTELEGMIQRLQLSSHPTKVKRDAASSAAAVAAAAASASSDEKQPSGDDNSELLAECYKRLQSKEYEIQTLKEQMTSLANKLTAMKNGAADQPIYEYLEDTKSETSEPADTNPGAAGVANSGADAADYESIAAALPFANSVPSPARPFSAPLKPQRRSVGGGVSGLASAIHALNAEAGLSNTAAAGSMIGAGAAAPLRSAKPQPQRPKAAGATRRRGRKLVASAAAVATSAAAAVARAPIKGGFMPKRPLSAAMVAGGGAKVPARPASSASIGGAASSSSSAASSRPVSSAAMRGLDIAYAYKLGTRSGAQTERVFGADAADDKSEPSGSTTERASGGGGAGGSTVVSSLFRPRPPPQQRPTADADAPHEPVSVQPPRSASAAGVRTSGAVTGYVHTPASLSNASSRPTSAAAAVGFAARIDTAEDHLPAADGRSGSGSSSSSTAQLPAFDASGGVSKLLGV